MLISCQNSENTLGSRLLIHLGILYEAWINPRPIIGAQLLIDNAYLVLITIEFTIWRIYTVYISFSLFSFPFFPLAAPLRFLIIFKLLVSSHHFLPLIYHQLLFRVDRYPPDPWTIGVCNYFEAPRFIAVDQSWRLRVALRRALAKTNRRLYESRCPLLWRTIRPAWWYLYLSTLPSFAPYSSSPRSCIPDPIRMNCEPSTQLAIYLCFVFFNPSDKRLLSFTQSNSKLGNWKFSNFSYNF